jgi:hypothetical protein
MRERDPAPLAQSRQAGARFASGLPVPAALPESCAQASVAQPPSITHTTKPFFMAYVLFTPNINQLLTILSVQYRTDLLHPVSLCCQHSPTYAFSGNASRSVFVLVIPGIPF